MGALVIGRTDIEAQEKLEEYRRHVCSEAALAHAAASLGIDFSRCDLDEPIETDKSQEIVSNVEAMTRSAGPRWTRRKLLEQMVLGRRQAPWTGSAERIADQLIGWTEETGVSGFNLSRSVVPECFDDVAQTYKGNSGDAEEEARQIRALGRRAIALSA
jgi:long-chain alkane monooxygenase